MFDEFYGLTGRPFQLTPDPEFYFESATHRKALSYLGYGLAQSEGFIVITGEIGAGKSTLVAHLTKKIDPAQMTVAQVVTSSLDGAELIHVVAQSFGLEIEGQDKAAALGAIEQFLHGEAREGRRCLLIVDESQNLSIAALEELRMLSNFQLGSHPLLQTLLLGQPEFKGKLADHRELEQLRQRVIAAHHLEAMKLEELEPYITHRLQCVGWEGNPDIDADVLPGLYEATGGVPRKVNQVMTRLLLLGAVEERTQIDKGMLAAVLTEMAEDAASSDASDAFPEAVDPAPSPIEGPATPPPGESQPSAPSADLDALVSSRDAQIAELQQAIVELAQDRSNQPELPADLVERLAKLEAMQGEQDRTLRYVLTMLIEWLERSDQRAAA